MLCRPRSLFAALLLLELAAPASRAEPITQIVAFGDSLSDTGNLFAASGNPPPPYFQGRVSNGPVWVEYLASRLGVAAPTPSLAGGTNNAWASAETGSGLSSIGVPNIGTQVALYLSGHTLNPNQLIAVWGGGNDFLGGQTNPAVPAANLAAAITTLANAGGREFLVPNLPQLGFLPTAQALSPDQQQALNALTLAYNAQLETQLGQLEGSLGITIHRLDVDGLLQEIRANPAGFGLTNVANGALNDGVLSGQGYLFWDSIHPTTATHQIIGERAFAAVVPEPSSLVLLSTAGASLLVWRRPRVARQLFERIGSRRSSSPG